MTHIQSHERLHRLVINDVRCVLWRIVSYRVVGSGIERKKTDHFIGLFLFYCIVSNGSVVMSIIDVYSTNTSRSEVSDM